MAEITFRGNKKLSSINSEWCSKFPYTYLRFYDGKGKTVGDWTNNHSEVRGNKGASEMKTTGNMHVGTFENRYEESFGSKVEIMYGKDGRYNRSLNDANAMSLSEYNDWCKAQGAENVLETHPEWFK